MAQQGLAKSEPPISVTMIPSANSSLWAFACAITISSQVMAQGSLSCNSIGFEGLADSQPIGTVPGPVSVTFGPSWICVKDSDAGGTGDFANEPSPDNVAFFVGNADPIDFNLPVQFVQFLYSAKPGSLPSIVQGWDGSNGTGNVVALATLYSVGSQSGGAPCSGDPGGDLCMFSFATVVSSSTNIRSLTITGAQPGKFCMDFFTVCSDVTVSTYCFGNACPCGNDFALGGCLNSIHLGAALDASGIPSAGNDTLVIEASWVPSFQTGIFFAGQQHANLPLGDGRLCISGPLIRFPVQTSDAAGSLIQGPGVGPTLGAMAGETWLFQAWYRDAAGPCHSGYNSSNALEVLYGL
ncbi:MAG: hypothetical protein ACI9F9_002235 [Candidatus Paceibacteria bacterium]|jgi:hypothetical protein